MATTALGLIAVELWTAREARAASLRERALFVADALVEISRAPSRDDAAYRLWASRASTMLPSGEAALDARGSGASVARVTWAVSHNLPPGDVIDKPESCGDVSVPAGSGCVALAFVP
ncbi:MAG: hypothetical protein PW947_23645 [Paraburkholderia sp.]|nr:hypothetical protein [Paraburkholderia sp.]MDE1183415.1 hypothetical protein [Paraburkholderia sp.]